jgi:hypothetical protein
MKLLTAIIILLCGLYCTYSAIMSLSAGKIDDIEDGFPPIKKKKSPAKFYLSIFVGMAMGIGLALIGVMLLWVQFVKQ